MILGGKIKEQHHKQQQQTKTKPENQIQMSSCPVLIRLLHLKPEIIIIFWKVPKNLQLELCVQFLVAQG